MTADVSLTSWGGSQVLALRLLPWKTARALHGGAYTSWTCVPHKLKCVQTQANDGKALATCSDLLTEEASGFLVQSLEA